jgi:hypothetical protein
VREVLFSVRDCSEPDCRNIVRKSHNYNNAQPRLTPRGRLLEYCVDLRHLAAHRATSTSSCATFKFRLFLGPPPLVTRCVNKEFYYIDRTFCIFWNIFTILTFLYNTVFYLQHFPQFNYNVHVKTLVVLPTFKISARQIPIAVYTVLRLLMMDSRSVHNM